VTLRLTEEVILTLKKDLAGIVSPENITDDPEILE